MRAPARESDQTRRGVPDDGRHIWFSRSTKPIILARKRPRATELCQSRRYEASELCVLCGILFERGPLGP
jgi:hypothetical protein